MTGERTTSRRDFLRVAGLSTAGVALAACAPAVAPAAGDAGERIGCAGGCRQDARSQLLYSLRTH